MTMNGDQVHRIKIQPAVHRLNQPRSQEPPRSTLATFVIAVIVIGLAFVIATPWVWPIS